MILEGWRDAVSSGRYTGVRYDCASPSVAHWINRPANKVGLTRSDFTAVAQTTVEQIAALPPPPPADEARPSGESEGTPDEELQTAPVPTPAPCQPAQTAPPRYRPRCARSGSRDARDAREARLIRER
jgi:hypothetical protein